MTGNSSVKPGFGPVGTELSWSAREWRLLAPTHLMCSGHVRARPKHVYVPKAMIFTCTMELLLRRVKAHA